MGVGQTSSSWRNASIWSNLELRTWARLNAPPPRPIQRNNSSRAQRRMLVMNRLSHTGARGIHCGRTAASGRDHSHCAPPTFQYSGEGNDRPQSLTHPQPHGAPARASDSATTGRMGPSPALDRRSGSHCSHPPAFWWIPPPAVWQCPRFPKRNSLSTIKRWINASFREAERNGHETETLSG